LFAGSSVEGAGKLCNNDNSGRCKDEFGQDLYCQWPDGCFALDPATDDNFKTCGGLVDNCSMWGVLVAGSLVEGKGEKCRSLSVSVACPDASTVPFNNEGIGSVTCGGEEYKTVKIASQVWMARNLNYAAAGSMCYDKDPSNCDKYGRLYDWKTAMVVCPEGWHLPSDDEWTTLTNYVESNKSCIGCAGRHLKAASGWDWDNNKNQSGNGYDAYGFSALPGGTGGSGGYFFAGSSGYWWSASEFGAYNAYYRGMSSGSADVSKNDYGDAKTNLYSVRCVQDY
jgi:uncharacterized protein (TIGR02145 family)